jgi:hypothetical protein
MAGKTKDFIEQACDATPTTLHPFKSAASEHLVLEFSHKGGQRISAPQTQWTEAAEHVGTALRALSYNGMLIKSR